MVHVVDVRVENADGFLLHLALYDGDLHPPIIRNYHANCEASKCCLLHKLLNENFLLREDVHVVVEGGGITQCPEVSSCNPGSLDLLLLT